MAITSQLTNKMVNTLRGSLLLLSDFCHRPVTASVENILIIRTDNIGDFVLWLGAARTLKDHYAQRQRKLFLVANATWSDFAASLGIFDVVVSVDPRRYMRSLMYRHAILGQIRRLECSLVLNPIYSRSLFCCDDIVRSCGASERIGWDGDCNNISSSRKRITDRWYTQLVTHKIPSVRELLVNAEFAAQLTQTSAKRDLASIDAKGDVFSGDFGESYYVLFPGATQTGRRWRPENFAEIATRIYQKTGWRGVLCGSSADHPAALTIEQSTAAPLSNWTGKTTLEQLAAMLKNSRLLVTNDTGAVHMAAAVGTPSVCILGGGHFGRFLPYPPEIRPIASHPKVVWHEMPCFGCRWRCIYKQDDSEAYPCVSLVSVQSVWGKVSAIIEQQGSRS